MGSEHIESLKIENFRGFEALAIDNLSDVNVFGGANGVGKSSILEALFHLADRLNPLTLFRSYQWRRIPLGPSENLDALKLSFHDRNIKRPIFISAQSREGKRLAVEFIFGHQVISSNVTQTVPQGELTKGVSETAFATTGEGISIKATRGNRLEYHAMMQVSAAGGVVNVVKNEAVPVPQSVIVTSSLSPSESGIAERYSSIVRKGKTEELDRFLRLVHPEIRGFQLLTLGGQMVLHANIASEGVNWVPLPLLGEGAVGLASAILAIAESSGGSVMLDELDASVHHSAQKAMWILLLEASIKFDVQLFATTHSESSLEALCDAVVDQKAQHRVAYHRIRRSKEGVHDSASYSGAELIHTLRQQWEVR